MIIVYRVYDDKTFYAHNKTHGWIISNLKWRDDYYVHVKEITEEEAFAIIL